MSGPASFILHRMPGTMNCFRVGNLSAGGSGGKEEEDGENIADLVEGVVGDVEDFIDGLLDGEEGDDE